MTSYERLLYTKERGLMPQDKINLVAEAYLTAGKISQAEHDEIVS